MSTGLAPLNVESDELRHGSQPYQASASSKRPRQNTGEAARYPRKRSLKACQVSNAGKLGVNPGQGNRPFAQTTSPPISLLLGLQIQENEMRQRTADVWVLCIVGHQMLLR
jgi:hypothetical protein